MARQNFIGLVVSQGKMQKTVKVRVETKVFNKLVNKELFRRKDYLVHDEGDISREGDLVRIEATRPLSKKKFFAIAEIIKNKGQQFALYQSQAEVNVAKEEYAKAQEFLKRRAEIDSKQDVVLINDIRTIQDALSEGKNPEELTEIKNRYGIESFTPQTIKKLLTLNVSGLEAQVESQKNKISNIQNKLGELMKDDAKAIEFLKTHGVQEPELLKKNIKKIY
ncbi:hypothetical protein TPHA_0H01950 [Tetrapisispora phaffii CBS 4417]|uniref:Uncharacterized protein n=1 Tax=Tetrapisispora phaffii (strain ATCC 24235 / CBS 4417 / NBRC 1672 / NRRL Y-8282 / UCD 70-5) TaxID=1071381 RepID=G8BWE9_TETPH|nr:mitochondrial 37S ribosomal protein MRPS17 TPHA_0H01950 [Tetrapisispora phaffii CBS 4417]CCE64400.1 hypothetical protein TPHA_0H01950 [Tetrapisispora phaffii CBS 4417]